MSDAVSCEGAPRDVGWDQGHACRAALRARYDSTARSERLRQRLSRRDARVARDLARYFPHRAEMTTGIAVGANVPRWWLVSGLDAGRSEPPALAVAAAAPQTVDGCRLARTLDGPCIVRRNRPEGVFRTVEVTRPWLPFALAGINERGLAAAVVADGPGAEGCAAPGALLIQDCLERFSALDAALDWCAARPGGGHATLLLADAHGDVAGVEISGSERRVLRPPDGLLLAGSARRRTDEIAKSLREAAPLDATTLAERMAGGGAVVLLDPESLCLALGTETFGL